MKSSWTGFHSPLAPGIDAFLAHKRALGCLFRVEELSLRLFDRFLIAQPITTLSAITPEVVDTFLVSRPRHAPRSYNHLRGTLVRLFDWLAAHDQFGPSPVRARPRRSTQSRLPCLFDDRTARRLLDIASQLPDKGGTVCRGATYRVIFTLLYGLGLRVGEVARLCVEDVDLTRDLLVIRQTKFYKSRLVPFGPRIHAVLRDHLARRARPAETIAASTPVFSLRGDRPVSAGTISQTFHHLVPQLGLSIPDGAVGPRVHDLRQHAGFRIMPDSTKARAFRAAGHQFHPCRFGIIRLLSSPRLMGREGRRHAGACHREVRHASGIGGHRHVRRVVCGGSDDVRLRSCDDSITAEAARALQ